ncbi:phosphatidate cytidylyltransferase [Inhella inkyongensis]|uniref:Phosphatidate cytidylyltransferase n=1 Tax=Inhella inkyongensis TaxID=392593 RepID=A0A840S0H1_9BURK|nr:phosphatidate cytidylyltransferase [Inhella inkyongensis]MBB5203755.1 phosphatidate cytidylyltransferase [Inhella inkyongensis]
MLKQRVITAVVLLALLAAVLGSAQAWPFALFAALTVSLAGWEWARLNGWQQGRAIALGAVVLGVNAGAVWALPVIPQAFWQLVLPIWVMGGAWALRGAAPGWSRLPQSLRLVVGPLLLLPAGLALVTWKSLGLNALLSVMCLVWAADVFAYFGGRAMGRRKLAPAISPGKSWEGVWSGMVGVAIVAVFWSQWIDVQPWVDGPSLYGLLNQRLGWLGAGLALLVLTALSVVGDLFESLVKRAAGAKDSSQLLPGHGGVLDRIDALLPVLPVALALI